MKSEFIGLSVESINFFPVPPGFFMKALAIRNLSKTYGLELVEGEVKRVLFKEMFLKREG